LPASCKFLPSGITEIVFVFFKSHIDHQIRKAASAVIIAPRSSEDSARSRVRDHVNRVPIPFKQRPDAVGAGSQDLILSGSAVTDSMDKDSGETGA